MRLNIFQGAHARLLGHPTTVAIGEVVLYERKVLVYVHIYTSQVFTPMLVLGYTLFAAALFVRVWMLLLMLRWEKVTVTYTIPLFGS